MMSSYHQRHILDDDDDGDDVAGNDDDDDDDDDGDDGPRNIPLETWASSSTSKQQPLKFFEVPRNSSFH